MMLTDKEIKKLTQKNPGPKPEESGNIVVAELLRIYDPTTQQNFVVRKS